MCIVEWMDGEFIVYSQQIHGCGVLMEGIHENEESSVNIGTSALPIRSSD